MMGSMYSKAKDAAKDLEKKDWSQVQGYLAHKKLLPPRTLQQACA